MRHGRQPHPRVRRGDGAPHGLLLPGTGRLTAARDRDTNLPDHLGRVVSSRPLHGGSIADVELVELEDGGRVVVKHTTYDAALEAEGLVALHRAGALTPELLDAAPHRLVLAFVEGTPDWRAFAERLARVHAPRAPGTPFGWHRDNMIGPLPQHNHRSTSWPDFFVEHRLLTHVHVLPGDLRRRLARAIDGGQVGSVLDNDPVPSLVHGDLWSGNVVDGTWLIDPAVHVADREFDLAFADLFGGFPPDFWHTYLEAWPLPEGWGRRRRVLQLYHLLVHVRLFGESWVPQVRDRLDQLGW